MERLLYPDVGLMAWTVVTFLAMVFILKKIAWGPLLKVLDEREEKIKGDVAAAEKNKADMEKLKSDYEDQLAGIEARARDLLQEAEQEGSQAREAILKDAALEARKIGERTRAELQAEKERLVRELRSEVGELSVQIAEKLIRRTVDKKVQESLIKDFLQGPEGPSKNVH